MMWWMLSGPETRQPFASSIFASSSTPLPMKAIGLQAVMKLVIAREFSNLPRVVLAHSPSRGLDVRATAAVHESLRSARAKGAAVLLISEDLDEILLLSDRVGVMNRGRISAEFPHAADRNAVGEAMVSHG